MGELFANPRLFSIPMKRVELTSKEKEKSCLQPGDLLFARRSLVAEGAGKCSIVMEVDEPTTFESSIIRARPDSHRLNSLFAYYLFNSPHGKYLLGTILRHVAVAGITGSDLVQLNVPLPPLPDQSAIAHILGSLDDKIELNRRMNQTLEATARAIFKSWFVDFDPVRAKAEGGDPGLPDDIAALFPDSFEDSELDEIPKGWKVKPIGEAVKCVGGSTPSTKNPAFWDGRKNPFVTPKDMSSLTSPVILDTSRHITDAGVDKISSGRLPTGTVILSSRAPIGYLAITEVPVSVNQGVIAMICNKDLPNYYVLYWTETNMETIKSNAGGTTFAEISKRNFRPIQVVVPRKLVLDAFVKQVEPLYKQIVLNLQESNSLASLRDTLLPKLISGELRIPDAEQLVEEADI
jgi:type I restriction enzyme S subunit